MDGHGKRPEVDECGPAPKRLRTTRATRRGGPRGGLARSTRTDASSITVRRAGAEPAEPPATKQPDPIAVPAYLPDEPISVSLTRYRTWQKAGAPHDRTCFACLLPSDLHGCRTCRRSYHDTCKSGGHTIVQEAGVGYWYCAVCVGRNWHSAHPSLSPPASPRSTALDEADQSSRPDASLQPYSHDPASRVDEGQDRENTLAPGDGSTVSIPATSHHRAVPMAVADTRPAKTAQSAPSRGSGTRRSRYSTLPAEVDSALGVLYAEIEAAAELRKQVTSLEDEVSQLRREKAVRDSELALAHKTIEKARASQSEILRLRSEAAERKEALDRAAGLEARNGHLELELLSARTQLSDTTRAFQEWKQKLSALVEP